MAALTFVTGNAGKLREFVRVMGDINCVSHKLDLPELQGEPEDISKEKCRLAVEQIKGPVCVEDTSLGFNALNGLPGPYIKWFLDKVGHDGLNKMLTGFDDKTGFAMCIFSYCGGPGEEIHTFCGKTPGTIVPARGPPHSFGWDPVFQPENLETTYAEMTMDEKNKISHRGRALAQLRIFFEENNLFTKD